MDTDKFPAGLAARLNLAPVAGVRTAYDLMFNSRHPKIQANYKTVPVDWEKFEQDIANAFERLP